MASRWTDEQLDELAAQVAEHDECLAAAKRRRRKRQQNGAAAGGSVLAAAGTLLMGLGALIGPILVWLSA